ncbi:hypothetical protein B0O99DRAFT_646571, partial [Bisporella sp. PMI_857]
MNIIPSFKFNLIFRMLSFAAIYVCPTSAELEDILLVLGPCARGAPKLMRAHLASVRESLKCDRSMSTRLVANIAELALIFYPEGLGFRCSSIKGCERIHDVL